MVHISRWDCQCVVRAAEVSFLLPDSHSLLGDLSTSHCECRVRFFTPLRCVQNDRARRWREPPASFAALDSRPPFAALCKRGGRHHANNCCMADSSERPSREQVILLTTNGNRALNQSNNVRNDVSIVSPLIRPLLGKPRVVDASAGSDGTNRFCWAKGRVRRSEWELCG